MAALNNLSNILSAQGKEEEALRYLKYTTEIYPDFSAAWINLGVAYENAGDPEKAMKCYNKAKDLDPSNAALWHNRHNRGLAFRRQNKFREAIQDYEISLRLRPLDVGTLYDKAFAHMSLSELDEAETCYDEILKVEPDHAEALGDKAVVQFEKGNHKEAMSLFDKALRLEPDNGRILSNKRAALEKL
jgi:tetratricopeptide (TPR) repeat protein